jgi:hypothetical protein
MITTRLLLLFLLGLLLTNSACTYLTNFVVVNGSNSAVEVSYKVKQPTQLMPPIQMIPVLPAILPASQLDDQVAWHDLSSSEFKFDPDNRMVVVSLSPGNALRIEHRNLVDGPTDEQYQSSNFAIEEINIVGASGEIHLKGEEARRSFVPMSKQTYVLMYR